MPKSTHTSAKAKQLIVIQIRKAAMACYMHSEEVRKVHKMILKEYGVSYNDVDCDPIIDEIEIIGGNGLSLEELDDALYVYSKVPKDRKIAAEEMGDL